MADLKAEYNALSYNNYDTAREFTNIFIDKKALPEVPVTGFQYAFFTAPELAITPGRFNISGRESDSNYFISNARELKLPYEGYHSIYNDRIVKMLSGEAGTFMPLFTNRSFVLPGSAEQLATIDYSETWNKYKIPLGTSTKDSKLDGSIEISFMDDDKLQITKSIKLWVDYIEGVFMGRVLSGYATFTALGDTQSQVIDYQSSLYVFTLKPDGKTIQTWAKYTGVFPTKIPYENFYGEDGDIRAITRIPIDFSFSYKEEMEINILRDFNLLGINDKSFINRPEGTFYDNNFCKIPEIGQYPGIAVVKNSTSGNTEFELRLQNPNDPYGLTQNF